MTMHSHLKILGGVIAVPPYYMTQILQLTCQFCSNIISIPINKILLKYQIYKIFLHLEKSIYIFQTEDKTTRESQYDQSIALNKVIDTI